MAQLPSSMAVQDLARSTSWTDVLATMEKLLPKLIVDEFRVAVKDIAFPTIRSFRGNLIIVDEGGSRIALAFKDEGEVELNGRPIKLRPLSTTKAEIERISHILEPRTASLLDLMIPSAQAGALLGTGLSAIAFAGASNHKAEACGGGSLSDALALTCSLSGTGMLHQVAVNTSQASTSTFKPISFKCPQENNNVIEVVKQNDAGALMRVKAAYQESKIINVKVEAAGPGERYSTLAQGHLDVSASNAEAKAINGAAKQLQEVKSVVCDSPDPDFRNRYKAILDSNRNSLKKTIPSGNSQNVESNLNAN